MRLREAEIQASQFEELYQRERQERDKLSASVTALMA